jgi:hypothetical protein
MTSFWAQISVCFYLLVHAGLSIAGNSVRDEEIAQCLPGEISTWGDGHDRHALSSPMVFVYRHVSAPAWFGPSLVLDSLLKASAAWSQCGITAKVENLAEGAPVPPGAILVEWSEEDSRRNFGLANLGRKTLSLGPSAFQLLQTRNPAFDSRQTLQMVISHEMGHLFGVMAHSRRCVDVTSYYDNGKGEKCSIRGGEELKPGIEYRALLPTACDIQRCRAANGLPTTTLQLNWR